MNKACSCTAVASMRRLASVKFYQILSIFIRLIILEDFIRLISYNGPCVRLGCSFFLATAPSCSAAILECRLLYFSPLLWFKTLCTINAVPNMGKTTTGAKSSKISSLFLPRRKNNIFSQSFETYRIICIPMFTW